MRIFHRTLVSTIFIGSQKRQARPFPADVSLSSATRSPGREADAKPLHHARLLASAGGGEADAYGRTLGVGDAAERAAEKQSDSQLLGGASLLSAPDVAQLGQPTDDHPGGSAVKGPAAVAAGLDHLEWGRQTLRAGRHRGALEPQAPGQGARASAQEIDCAARARAEGARGLQAGGDRADLRDGGVAEKVAGRGGEAAQPRQSRGAEEALHRALVVECGDGEGEERPRIAAGAGEEKGRGGEGEARRAAAPTDRSAHHAPRH